MNYERYKRFLREDFERDDCVDAYADKLECEVCRLVWEARESFAASQLAQKQFYEGTWHGYTTQDYRDSLWAEESDNMFTLAYQWQDKKHRHVQNLCNWIDMLQKQNKDLNERLEYYENRDHEK